MFNFELLTLVLCPYPLIRDMRQLPNKRNHIRGSYSVLKSLHTSGLIQAVTAARGLTSGSKGAHHFSETVRLEAWTTNLRPLIEGTMQKTGGSGSNM